MIVRQRQQLIGIALLHPVFVEPILRRAMHFKVYTGISHGSLQLFKSGSERFGSVFECGGCDVRSEEDTRNAHIHFAANERKRIFDCLCTMVYTRKQVAMNIGAIRQLNFFLLISKKPKHIPNINFYLL